MSIQFDKVQPKNKAQLKSLIDYAFNHNIYDLNFIDTSEITDMSMLFRYSDYNFDVSDWDVSNVTNMNNMFYCCNNFDCDLSNWDVSNVTNMHSMFNSCFEFTGKGLENWNVSNVIDMSYVFCCCENFNCDLSNWNVSNVIDMSNLFIQIL